MKQSSIEWLFENYLPLKKGLELNHPLVVELYNKAKEIHKQEVIDGIVWFDETERRPHEIEIEAKKYYNETYNIKR